MSVAEPEAMAVGATAGRHRPVRSFVLREGRLTPGQERAFRELWPRFGWDWRPGDPLDLGALFAPRTAASPATRSPTSPVASPRNPSSPEFGVAARGAPKAQIIADPPALGRPGAAGNRQERPITLEIGFGDGESLAAMAAAAPERDFVGIEVHRPGIGHLLLRLEQLELTNLRVLRADAMAVLNDALPAACLDRVQLFFPDPWPKKRHHKRRLIQPAFLDLAARKLIAGGELCIATDWAGYAEHIDEALAGCDRLQLVLTREHDGSAPIGRPTTRFERRGLGKGHRIRDWLLRRV